MNSNILNSLEVNLPSYFICSKSKKSGQSSSEFATLRFRVLHFLSWFLWVFVIFRNLDGKMNFLHTEDSIHIREVWNDNLEHEFGLIRNVVDDFPFVAMDTEFPGVVVRPLQESKSRNEYNFRTLKANVDVTKLIQLGLTFSDKDGNLPTCGTGKFCVWQFNFREFDIDEDFYAFDSIELLTRSKIDLRKFRKDGVDAIKFGELLIPSGVVLNDDMHWVTFHSPYDFGYLIKLLTGKNLPDTPREFFYLMKIFFPVHYDIKHLMKFVNGLHGGLTALATRLDLTRVGTSHQAGSDSLLTSSAFVALRNTFFKVDPVEKYAGVLYGFEGYNE